MIRGKTGRVFGHLQALLTIIKGLPLAYNKDFQEDKEPIFDTVKTVSDCLKAMNILIKDGLIIEKENLLRSVEEDFSNSTDLADYLVSKNVPFREAYQTVGSIVKLCLSRKKLLKDLSLEELQNFNEKFEEDIFEKITPRNVVDSRNSIGGTGFEQVSLQLKMWKSKLLN